MFQLPYFLYRPGLEGSVLGTACRLSEPVARASDTLNESLSPQPFSFALRIPFGLSTFLSVCLCNFVSIFNCEICFIDVHFLSVLFREKKVMHGTQKRTLKKCLFAFLLHFGDFYQLHYFIVVFIYCLLK